MRAAKKISTGHSVRYSLDDNGCFVIENYNQSKLFSNFFPGISGLWGIPMWVFFVNRGQCISSFGIEGKDKSILEFQPANKAYRLTSLQGFRTFIKVRQKNKSACWEPFQIPSQVKPSARPQVMALNAHDLSIQDHNASLGLTVNVNYFTLPGEDYPALIRRVTITNTSSKKCDCEIIDGLPAIVPYGVKDWLNKNLSRTVEAWVKVGNIKNRAPFYRLNVEVDDTSDVKHITEGNFYFSFEGSGRGNKLLEMVVEPECLFGAHSDFITPENFLDAKNFSVPSKQMTNNKTPCAMSYARLTLPAKGSREIISFAGFANDEKQLKRIVTLATQSGFVDKKSRENEQLISSVKSFAFTNSSDALFNQYCSQTFLDNVLRGGLPVSLKTESGVTAFNVYSRKHGDLERDYNYFVLSPTYFSQGNGNYRDVNQNRRNDTWVNSDVGDNNIINFLNLTQADGYNPLIVKGLSFSIPDTGVVNKLLKDCFLGGADGIGEALHKGFQPGMLMKQISTNGCRLKGTQKQFLEKILGHCQRFECAEHGEGFWSDHWTYNLDLIESYLSLYPEKLRTLLLEKKVFSFYHNDHYVLARSERYYKTDKGIRQYCSVFDGSEEIPAGKRGNKLRTEGGNGNVYLTSLLVKLLCLISNKAASFDPSGFGIEMEADKPNWNDSLNGLPGLTGSSLSETLELKRYCLFVLHVIEKCSLADGKVNIFTELAEFIDELKSILENEGDPLAYWSKSNDAKERYRMKVRQGIDGKEDEFRINEIVSFLSRIIAKTNYAIENSEDKNGLFPTYFYHEVTRYETIESSQKPKSVVLPLEFKCHTLPYFLEGFVHALRIEKDIDKARRIYENLKKSPLYDKKLKMYKINADLSDETEEIGRSRIFPKGWLENESVWLHMEYKYLLEILRAGLHDEFYQTFYDILVPFLKPETYGRSTLENSSFIVSSAHEDSLLHGRGFVARLSGSTAEFISIWLAMNLGKQPFKLDQKGDLSFAPRPVLKADLFTRKATHVPLVGKALGKKRIALPANTYAFTMLGHILVVYHNPERKNTYGKNGCHIKEFHLSYPGSQKSTKITSGTVGEKYALDIREGRVERIDVFFE